MRTIVDKVFDMLYKYQEEQLHFFWAFSVTTLAVFWQPLLVSGLVVTVAKEIMDKKHPLHNFSWKDCAWGLGGWITGLVIVSGFCPLYP